jgi:hypothetical protein
LQLKELGTGARRTRGKRMCSPAPALPGIRCMASPPPCAVDVRKTIEEHAEDREATEVRAPDHMLEGTIICIEGKSSHMGVGEFAEQRRTHGVS